MAEVPPPNYVAYPRSNTPATYGTVEQLEALGQGYFGFNVLFLATLGTYWGCAALAYEMHLNPYPICLPAVFVVVLLGSYSLNRKVAFGKGWNQGHAILATILMALNAILCCGIIGFVVMQNIALKEINKYGLKTGAFGLTGKKFKAFVAERKNAETQGYQPPTMQG